MKRVITYGTFDVFHYGHLRILERARQMGDELYVGVSTDLFNYEKGKLAFESFPTRRKKVFGTNLVNQVFAENSMSQKCSDIARLKINILVMGDDWKGAFDYLHDICEVRYLMRTPNVSSTMIRNAMKSSQMGQSLK
ncbi:glycerol-3-phosphate cytidylyltransferase (plasmid) [Octadecabacter arcticus 238]|uniref:Glycerol-3-phosphate cytidylyltransferase n=1 Tax=Octadecabacter arcticus 238 TaxID=391616 RepID=M9RSI6_9RHOB|nr:adenylyltransferase/cytidyltransferase family protein [Octadecabacter arcticus]AGI74713.1 glycerol-3-phosphate cytidylyltransferase [Octadecabacter arcticus 238]